MGPQCDEKRWSGNTTQALRAVGQCFDAIVTIVNCVYCDLSAMSSWMLIESICSIFMNGLGAAQITLIEITLGNVQLMLRWKDMPRTCLSTSVENIECKNSSATTVT